MSSSLDRVRGGLIVLGAVILISYVGYLVAGYDWIAALWMLVVTISTVGYAEESQRSSAFQLFSVFVIVFGITAVAYAFGGFVRMTLEGELARALGHRRTTRGIEQLKGHVVICGFGRMGRFVTEDLHQRGRQFVVIDNDPGRADEAQTRGYLFLPGDATEDEVLEAAGVTRARTIVTGLPNDAANVFITLTSRNLNPDVQIISRAEHPSTEGKLRQAGADRIVMPSIVGANHVVRLITRPSTADLMDLVTERSSLDVELDEVNVPDESSLIGVSVEETEIRRRHQLLVVAVKQADGTMVFNPNADYRFAAGDAVITMGRAKDITAFRHRYGVI